MSYSIEPLFPSRNFMHGYSSEESYKECAMLQIGKFLLNLFMHHLKHDYFSVLIAALMPQVKGEPANFSQKLTPKSVTEGEALDLIAKVTGTEPITATWTKDRKPIKDSDGYKISYDKGTCRLYIADAKPADSGEFKVEVKNQFGSAFCSASLGVKG